MAMLKIQPSVVSFQSSGADSVMPMTRVSGMLKTLKAYAWPMHRWIASAAGGTSQREYPRRRRCARGREMRRDSYGCPTSESPGSVTCDGCAASCSSRWCATTNVLSRSLFPPVLRLRSYFGNSADDTVTRSRWPGSEDARREPQVDVVALDAARA